MKTSQLYAWVILICLLGLVNWHLDRIEKALERQEQRLQHIDAAVSPWPCWGPACRGESNR